MKRLLLTTLLVACLMAGTVLTAEVKNSAETLPGPGPMVIAEQ